MSKSRLAQSRTSTPVGLPPPARDLFDRFMRHRRATRAKGTAVRSRVHVLQWLIWLEQRGITAPDAKVVDAQDFLAAWDDWGWSPLTKRAAVSDLRVLHEWMLDTDITLTGRNPWRNIHLPRRPRRIPRVPTQQEVDAIDRAVRKPTVRDLRDRAMLNFLRSSGARVSDARSLDMDRLDLGRRQAIVYGKGAKDRVVLFDDVTADALVLWIDMGRPEWAKPGEGRAVFIGRHGERINASVIYDAMMRAMRYAGVGRHLHPHSYRHGVGTAVYQATHDLLAVQAILGHSDVSTAQVYVHMNPQHAREAYERTFGRSAAN